MRQFGLIGYPLSHSFSEKYFEDKFTREGLTDFSYKLFPLESVTRLPGLLKEHPGIEGLNVTIPYKKQVLQYLDDRENIPEGIDACNCMRIRNGKISGFNTDIIGFEESLKRLLKPHHKNALVLGSGGAAAAVKHVLRKLGISFRTVSRKKENTSLITYDGLDKEIIETSTLIVNTTPSGMYPNEDTFPDIPYQFLSAKHLLYDLVYNPAKTLFLQKGQERGAAIKNGEEMLVLQAEASWAIWNG